MPSQPLERIATCRACEGTELTEAFCLPGEDPWVFCGDGEGRGGCGLLQRASVCAEAPLLAITPPSWTEQYRRRTAAAEALEMMTTRDGCALDIGCGDGALLSAYPRWVSPVGIDPRLPASGGQDWGYGLAEDFVTQDGQDALDEAGFGLFDVITAVGVLEEAEDPLAFLLRARDRLAEDGVLVLETPYAALALTRTLGSAFHDRARAVYMLSVLERLARAAALKIVRGAMTETAAGSIRLFLTHAAYAGHDYEPWTEGLARLWDEEAALALHGPAPYRAFAARHAARAAEIQALGATAAERFEHAYALCGGERMAAALRGAGLPEGFVTGIVGEAGLPGYAEGLDRLTEDEARSAPPDILIAPAWRRRESLEQWHGFVMEGGKLWFVEPELHVIDAHNYATELGRALAVTDGPGSVESLRAALSAMQRPALSVVAERRA
ncbi:class I SAM-dependent methyltransferase [Parvularcula dongshanensis]|uniref:2-polyprenyl-3-methyl-5-hydroxy-6-metoxy-1, 4-benzoquinol methylase n=1 Tax=Parvularcula dongshanensis TaxID=1173995 RepID=A0A840I0L0_9PROT|nr:class I SAM-dependent methyltransferase [Parvularcula dongshanensis]MBB4657813.1 2-polyprenyl-3-methyl-5-hydroxy-6-metoxy-1,4-benzoquinol methylase [Parvularcula dongshanensis]